MVTISPLALVTAARSYPERASCARRKEFFVEMMETRALRRSLRLHLLKAAEEREALGNRVRRRNQAIVDIRDLVDRGCLEGVACHPQAFKVVPRVRLGAFEAIRHKTHEVGGVDPALKDIGGAVAHLTWGNESKSV